MLRALVGFDHCPKLLALNSWQYNSGYTTYSPSLSGGFGKNIYIDNNGWLTTPAGVSPSGYTNLMLNLAPFPVSGTPTKIFIGIRMKVVETFQSSYYIGLTDLSKYAMQLLADSDLPAANSAVGAISYLEFVLNITTRVIAVYVNSTFIKNVGMPAELTNAQLLARLFYLEFRFSGNNSGNSTMAYRDIYVSDDVAGDGFVGMLGPQQLVPIYADVISGTDWTTTDGGSLLSTLTRSADSTNTSVATSGASKAPLDISLKCDVADGQTINAVSLLFAGNGNTASNQFGVSLKNGSDTLAGAPVTPGTTLKYTFQLGVYPKAPGGVAWTKANIDSTSLLLTPDIVS